MINSQTPPDRDAFFEQYSEEQVRHAFDMVADENGQLPEELTEYQQAYDEMTVDPAAMSRYREVLKFREALFRATPRVFITRLLLAANVLVFLAMAFSGVNVMSPSGEDLIPWGANAGWLTLDGQSWRLFTCMFLHIGLIHIALNMYILWQVGNLLERLTGNAGFLILYLGSGLIASLCSLYWNESVLSAGASGAVCGAFGGLAAFLWRSPDCDMEVFGPLLSSIAKVVLFNLGLAIVLPLFLPINLDNAAHLGGLVSGTLLGLCLARPIITSTKQDILFRNALALGLSGGLVVAGLYWAPEAPQNPYKIANDAVQLEEAVNALAEQQRKLEMKHGQRISELIEENRSNREDIPKVLAGNGAINTEFSKWKQALQEKILPKWKEYERQAETTRTIWPAMFKIEPLDQLINFIKERRAETEKRINTVGEPPPKAANALNCPAGHAPVLSHLTGGMFHGTG